MSQTIKCSGKYLVRFFSGNCVNQACDAGFYGSKCNLTCPSDCAVNPNTNTAYCDVTYGNCTHGCIDGRWGEKCLRGCSSNCARSSSNTEAGNINYSLIPYHLYIKQLNHLTYNKQQRLLSSQIQVIKTMAIRSCLCTCIGDLYILL